MASDPIGHVETVAGEVLVTHADGSQETLTDGAPVYQGDVIQTGPGGAVAIVFIDDTTFALDEDARMVLDELIFDPEAEQGGAVFSVLQGAFTFATGKIVEDEPDNMIINTPVAMIGISGTAAACSINLGASSICVLIHGAITVSNGGGSVILDEPGEAAWIPNFVTAPGVPFMSSDEEFEGLFGRLFDLFPGRFGDFAPEAGPGSGDAGFVPQGGTFRANGLLDLGELFGGLFGPGGIGQGVVGTGVPATMIPASFGLNESFGNVPLELGGLLFPPPIGGAPPPPGLVIFFPPQFPLGAPAPAPLPEDFVLTNILPASPIVLVIPAQALLANDAPGVIIVAVAGPVGGPVAIDGDGNVVFTTPDLTLAGYAGFTGSFVYFTSDGVAHLVEVTGFTGATLTGGDEAEIFFGSAAVDTINTGGGDDFIVHTIGDGDDVIVGGDGIDTLIVIGSDGAEDFNLQEHDGLGLDGHLKVLLEDGTEGTLDVDGVEKVVVLAGDGDDTFLIEDLSNTDVLLTTVTIDGGPGEDELTLLGSAGGDVIVIVSDAESTETVTSTIDGVDQPSNVLSGVESITVAGGLGDGDDILDASGVDDSLSINVDGGDGADTITGGGGNDILIGSSSEDRDVDILDGGAGNDEIHGGIEDELFGGDGDDVLGYLDGNGSFPAVVDGGDGLDTLELPDEFIFISTLEFFVEDVEIIDISAIGSDELTINSADDVATMGDTNSDIPEVGDYDGTTLELVDLLVIGETGDDVDFSGGDWELDTDNDAQDISVDGIDIITFDVYRHADGGGGFDAFVAVQSDLDVTLL